MKAITCLMSIAVVNSFYGAYLYAHVNEFYLLANLGLYAAHLDALSELVGSFAKTAFGAVHNRLDVDQKLKAFYLNGLLMSLNFLSLIGALYFKLKPITFVVFWLINRVINNLSGVSRDFINVLLAKSLKAFGVTQLKGLKSLGNVSAMLPLYLAMSYLNITYLFLGLGVFVIPILATTIYRDQELKTLMLIDANKIRAAESDTTLGATKTVLQFILVCCVFEMPHLSEQMLYHHPAQNRSTIVFFKSLGQLVIPAIFSLICLSKPAREKWLYWAVPSCYLVASYCLSWPQWLPFAIGTTLWGGSIVLSQSAIVVFSARQLKLKSLFYGLGSVISALVYTAATWLSCKSHPIITHGLANSTINYQNNLIPAALALVALGIIQSKLNSEA